MSSSRVSTGGIFLAELVGTFLLIFLGDGVVAQVALAPRLAPEAYDWLLITVGWGLAVAIAVYVTGGVSGAHINPAVTIANAALGTISWGLAGVYIVAQFIGAILGAAAVYTIYYDGLVAAGMPNVWATGPGSVISQAAWGKSLSELGGASVYVGQFSFTDAFITEILATMVLLIGVLALTDSKNMAPSSNLGPFMIGLLVVAIGISLGGPSGYALNPARDLGPRIFGALVGTKGLFNGWYWIGPPVIGTIIGGLLGAAVYKGLVAPFLPKRE